LFSIYLDAQTLLLVCDSRRNDDAAILRPADFLIKEKRRAFW